MEHGNAGQLEDDSWRDLTAFSGDHVSLVQFSSLLETTRVRELPVGTDRLGANGSEGAGGGLPDNPAGVRARKSWCSISNARQPLGCVGWAKGRCLSSLRARGWSKPPSALARHTGTEVTRSSQCGFTRAKLWPTSSMAFCNGAGGSG